MIEILRDNSHHSTTTSLLICATFELVPQTGVSFTRTNAWTTNDQYIGHTDA